MLTEFDQKQSLGSGGVDFNNCDNEASDNDIGIKSWVPTYSSVFKLLSLCPRLRSLRLLAEEKHLAVFAEALSDMDEHFDIQELEVINLLSISGFKTYVIFFRLYLVYHVMNTCWNYIFASSM